jgi:hypothetical protein
MRIYHQTGHNWKWNVTALEEDNAGFGLIVSPVNLSEEKVLGLPSSIRERSFFDPQTYLPRDVKGQLSSYSYFPGNLRSNVQTAEYDEIAAESARECIDLQIRSGLAYITIPTRYFGELPSDHLQQSAEYIVDPFIAYYRDRAPSKPLLLTVIVKPIQLTDQEQKSALLNWITSIHELSGVYVIFENGFQSKQVKDAAFLAGALEFIHSLRMNDLEVHIGYANTESYLYSIAQPTSVAMGSYENLRRFGIERFVAAEGGQRRGPNPRLYSGALLQWVDYGYLGAIQSLYPNWREVVEDSSYRPLMFSPQFRWHFQKPELYKHYFTVFSRQIDALPDNSTARIDHVQRHIETARSHFDGIDQSGVVLDSDSDGSHLPFWLTAINLHKRYLSDLGL